ncbi:MAG: RING finger domain-containing protein [Candidatus Helarchaeota archaeon]
MTTITDTKKVGWETIAILIGFIIYETITIFLQFILFIASDFIEMGLDLVFIMLLVFFYDIDALILLIELIPFIDLIPLFVIYMLVKIATIDQPRRPLISLDWGNWGVSDSKSIETTTESKDLVEESRPKVVPRVEKVFYAITNEEVCAICMQQLEDGDEIVTCPNGHLAHINHIRPWTESMNRGFCPVCRIMYPRVLISKTYVKSDR